MRAGELDQRVTVQQVSASGSPAQNEFGEPEQTWAAVTSIGDAGTVWAKVEQLSGREFEQARARHAEVTAKVTIRYVAGLTAGMSFLHGSTVYDIKSIVRPTGRAHWLECLCTTGTGTGG